MKRSKTSKAWMHEHVNDPFVKQAQADGYRSRAAYKLLEIDGRDRLFRRGMTVVDLGAAPGSWCQVAVQKVGPEGRVFALDLLEMQPVAAVDFIQGDFREEGVLLQLQQCLQGRPVDLVLSDMAPNISGVNVSDQARAEHLVELALEFAAGHLQPEGRFLAKFFQGAGFEPLLQAMRTVFHQVQTRKPKASRDRSSEIYLLGARLRGRE